MFKNLQTCIGSAVLSVGVGVASPAIASGDAAMKTMAIFGSLFSYGYAGVNRADFAKCDGALRGFYQRGKDSELSVNSVGVSFSDCNLQRKGSDPGFGFRISPAVMASRWSADAGTGADSAFEITLVPQARYIWEFGAAKVDLMFGIGVSYLSESDIGARLKSTGFQFSDELGVGISDRSERLRVGYSYRHVSNANIQTPNNNVDFHGVSVSIRFD